MKKFNHHTITTVLKLKDHVRGSLLPEQAELEAMRVVAEDIIWDCDGITSFAKRASRTEKRPHVRVLLEEWRITAQRNRWLCVTFLETRPSRHDELAAVLNCMSRERRELKEATHAAALYIDSLNADALAAAI